MSQTLQTTQPPAPELPQTFDRLGNLLLTPSGLTLLGLLATLGILHGLDSMRKGKPHLATARWGNRQEKANARRKGLEQIEGRVHNEVALYVGTPKDRTDTRTFYLPDAQRGTAVSGSPGSGKTFSVLDPAIRSALQQGFPTIVYDFKYPQQTQRLAAFAARLGYEVRIFAPGFTESAVCNPLDFLRDESDTGMARQFAEVLNKNFRLVADAKSDRFFDSGGDQLTEGALAFAKGTPYPDLLMAQSILALPDLAKRVAAAADINPWVRKSFDQLISVKDSEKTAAGITASAADAFSRFMKPDVLGAFVGTATLPLDLEGKKLLIFGIDRNRRDVVSPLVAAVLHLLVTRNVSAQRRDPLVLALDELPTLYLPQLVNWINESREDGLVTLLGFQNLAQLEKTYGREVARAIFGACSTKAIFNPGEIDSAKMFSEFLGQEEVTYNQKSHSYGKGGRSRSESEHRQTRPLLEASQFLKLKTGEGVLISPHFASGAESYLPIRQPIRLPPADLKQVSASKALWSKVRQRLIARSPKNQPTAEDLKRRMELAQVLLPLPENPNGAHPLDELSDRLQNLL